MRPDLNQPRFSGHWVLVCLGLLVAATSAVLPSVARADARTLNQLVKKLRPLDQTLGNSAVTALVQTRDGYLWVGTDAGLARFDGVRFEVFTTLNTEALATDHISALVEGRD